MEDLQASLTQYSAQLSMVNTALIEAEDGEKDSLVALQSDLHQLIQLTQENLDALTSKETPSTSIEPNQQNQENTELDDEYALFMQEMVESGAYKEDSSQEKPQSKESSDSVGSAESDIEDELATLLGMKCAVYHTHKWGGQPTLHNAMVCAVMPRQGDDQFNDLQVRVLYTHPTHAEMLPCPFFLDGECRFDDEQCRYSHGTIVHLSNLKEAIAPDFRGIKVGSRILLKLKPPSDEDISLTKKSSERYHLWHRAVVNSVDEERKTCAVKLESGAKTGDKRMPCEEYCVSFEEIFPLTVDDDGPGSEDSLSDTEYPQSKATRPDADDASSRPLLVEKSLLNNAPAMGEWERHTRGIGSKLMLAMGYVPGRGLGSSGEGRLQPVAARVVPLGRSLDHCMELSEKHDAQDPSKVEQRLKRLQKKEEDRNKRAYEREKEKERRNVFNFINKTLGDKSEDGTCTIAPVVDIKQSTSKDLNIEQFKITEDTKKVEREILKLNSSLCRHAAGSEGYRRINSQIAEKNKELQILKSKEKQIAKEQTHRKDKLKMTVF